MLACEHAVAVEGRIQCLLPHIVDHGIHRGPVEPVEHGIHRGPLDEVNRREWRDGCRGRVFIRFVRHRKQHHSSGEMDAVTERVKKNAKFAGGRHIENATESARG